MFGITKNLPVPPPVPDKPPEAAQSHRTRYVVIGVMSERTSEAEMLYTIRLRRADQGVPPAYLYRVAQTPGLPVPATTNAVLDLDPRLVTLESAP